MKKNITLSEISIDESEENLSESDEENTSYSDEKFDDNEKFDVVKKFDDDENFDNEKFDVVKKFDDDVVKKYSKNNNKIIYGGDKYSVGKKDNDESKKSKKVYEHKFHSDKYNFDDEKRINNHKNIKNNTYNNKNIKNNTYNNKTIKNNTSKYNYRSKYNQSKYNSKYNHSKYDKNEKYLNDYKDSEYNKNEKYQNDREDSINNINSIITDINGTKYIGIYNYKNSYCYYLTAIHRLHGSKTFNDNLDLIFKNGEKEEIKIFKIFEIYNELQYNQSDDVREKIYNSMKQYEKIIDECLDEKLNNGGDPYDILRFLFFPIIFNYYGEELFQEILVEINFNLIHLKNTEYNIKIFKRNELNQKLLTYYEKILEFKNSSKIIQYDKPFCNTTIAVYFNDSYKKGNISKTGGHAITMVLGKDNKLYIIDDDKNIMEINNYFHCFLKNINKLEIKDINDEIKNKLTSIGSIYVDQKIYRTIITPNVNLSGGEAKDTNEKQTVNKNNIDNSQKYKQISSLSLIFLFALIVILIILVILYYYNSSVLSKNIKEIEKYQIKISEIENTQLIFNKNIENETKKILKKIEEPPKILKLNKYISVVKPKNNFSFSFENQKNENFSPLVYQNV